MKYVKLFESWLNEEEQGEIELTGKDIQEAFPITTDMYGEWSQSTGKSWGKDEKEKQEAMKEFSKWLSAKLTGLTKNLSTKFKVVINKGDKENDGNVEISVEGKPGIKFFTSGNNPFTVKSSNKKVLPYEKTMFSYYGWVYEDGNQVTPLGNKGSTFGSADVGYWTLGEFLASTLQKEESPGDYLVSLKRSPKELALNIAMVKDASKSGKVRSTSDIASTALSTLRNIAPERFKPAPEKENKEGE